MKLGMTMITLEAPDRCLLSASCANCGGDWSADSDREAVVQHGIDYPGHVITVEQQVTEIFVVGVLPGVARIPVDVNGSDAGGPS